MPMLQQQCMVKVDGMTLPNCPGEPLNMNQLAALPLRLRASQGVFKHTGGLHAAALFDSTGNLLAVREDIGQHDARDKRWAGHWCSGAFRGMALGYCLASAPATELLRKSVVAGVTTVCAHSAPSSYAVHLPRKFGVTLMAPCAGGVSMSMPRHPESSVCPWRTPRLSRPSKILATSSPLKRSGLALSTMSLPFQGKPAKDIRNGFQCSSARPQ